MTDTLRAAAEPIRDALHVALDALRRVNSDQGYWHGELEREIELIRATLAAEQPQPLARLIRGEGGAFSVRPDMDNLRAIYALPTGEHPLYAASPPPAAAPTDAMVEAAWKAMKVEPTVPMTTAVRERLRASIKAGIEAALREQGR